MPCHARDAQKDAITPVRSIWIGGATQVAPCRRPSAKKDDQMVCERCGAEMYRMHAVWRCSAAGSRLIAVGGNRWSNW